MANLFRKLIKAEISEYPFPHIVVKDFFDFKEYDQISEEFPKGSDISQFRLDLEDHIAMQLMNGIKWEDMPEVSEYKSVEKELIKSYQLRNNGKTKRKLVHSHQNTAIRINLDHLDFFSGFGSLKRVSQDWNNIYPLILSKFRPYLPKSFRSDDEKFEALKKISYPRGDVRVNTKVTLDGTTTLGPHLDNENELLAGLVYFRDPRDPSTGGDLDLYKLNNPDSDKFMSPDRRIPFEAVTKVKTVPYQRNMAIFFVNSLTSIHGVSARTVGDYERRILNVSVELPHKITLWKKGLGVDKSLTSPDLGQYNYRKIN